MLFKSIIIAYYVFLAFASDGRGDLNGQNQRLYILVFGAAGFLGNSLLLHVHKVGIKSLGIDNFNGATTSIALKRRRQRNLKIETGLDIIEADACDSNFVNVLLLSNKFTHILYFASQPGNR